MEGLRLSKFERNVYSQTGEDGILEALLERLPTRSQWCVEFGAWDGKHLSNTWRLIKDCGYSAVLIEADRQRYEQLVEGVRGLPVTPICEFVGFRAQDNLDTLLSRTDIPQDFDVLSIDVDGNDYHIWDATSRYRPKIVVVEYNPSIANGVEFVQPRDPSVQHGASATSMVKLARSKGYELVAVTRLNCIFVRDDLYPALGVQSNSLEALRLDTSDVTHLFCGYDGRVFISGSGRLPWHGLSYDLSRFQHLPVYLRGMPPNYNGPQKLVYRFLRLRQKIRGMLAGR